MRAIRASEIGVFLFCRRAWWYQKRGVESENQMELANGDRLHRQHRRKVIAAGLTRLLAYLFLLVALAALVVFLLGRVL